MKTFFVTVFVAIVAFCRVADAKSYIPLGALENAPAASRAVFFPAKTADRPFLPGMRPPEVELMEDALRRKNSRTIGADRAKAHQSIIRNALRGPVQRSHAKGILAEALYLEKNPQWGYVAARNAPQNDIYTWIRGRKTPFTGQVKTHASADPGVYARDMRKDYRSNLFLVPEDHVAPLKGYWRQRLADSRNRGLTTEADVALRQLARVRSLGFTSKKLNTTFNRIARFCIRENHATYVSLGAGMALALGPDLWELWRTGSLSVPAKFRLARGGSLLVTERAAAFGMSKFATGAWRGGLRGNFIAGSILLAVDTGFSIYENGGAQAFQTTGFYTHVGGSIGGMTLGFAVGTPVGLAVTAWAAPTGPWAPVIGGAAGLVSGGVAGMAGYIGGDATTRRVLESINPDFLHVAENQQIREIQESLSSSIAALQKSALTLQRPG